jgi:4-amino-4-deoxy-L-arabinose transferase-like glycosyltransferase
LPNSRFNRWPRQRWPDWLLLGLLPLAFLLRVYGLDWDGGLFFHPDERQILMVVERLTLPNHWGELFTAASPLNPRFFAYGSFPLYLLRVLSWIVARWQPAWASMSHFYVLGRLLSALFDTLTVLFTYILACKLFDRRVALLTAVFVTFTVLHIQLAHFYTVDGLLAMLIVLAIVAALDVARYGRRRDAVLLGLLFGIALATKVSVLPLALVVGVAWMASALGESWSWGQLTTQWRMAWDRVKGKAALSLGTAVVCFFVLQPYALIDAYQFVTGVGQEIAMSQGWYDFPYTRQYAGTLPYLYQARQVALFAMGPPLAMLGLVGLLWLSFKAGRQPTRDWVVVLAWPLLYVLTQGAAYAKFIRYTLPLLPFLGLTGAAVWVVALDAVGLRIKAPKAQRACRAGLIALLGVVLLCTIFYALAFLHIYRQPHTWVQASSWLCQELVPGSTVLTEEWDDPLPARGVDGSLECPSRIVTLRIDMYAPDDQAKLERLLDAIETADYIVLSSQRLYAPISRLAERYPISSRYYQALFAERLGFELVAAPASYPQLAGVTLLDNPRAGLLLPIPPLLASTKPGGWVVDLGQADESFTVYDHPQPLVFAKVAQLPRTELESWLSP